MTDDNFIKEIQEDVRIDKLKDLWTRYGNLLIGFLLALVLSVGGYVGYEHYENKKNSEQSLLFEKFLANPQDTEAFKAVVDLKVPGYTLIAYQQHTASSSVPESKKAEMYSALSRISYIPSFHQEFADISAYMARFNNTKGANLARTTRDDLARLKHLKVFSHEFVALSALKAGKVQKAQEALQTLLQSPSLKPGQTKRVMILRDKIK